MALAHAMNWRMCTNIETSYGTQTSEHSERSVESLFLKCFCANAEEKLAIRHARKHANDYPNIEINSDAVLRKAGEKGNEIADQQTNTCSEGIRACQAMEGCLCFDSRACKSNGDSIRREWPISWITNHICSSRNIWQRNIRRFEPFYLRKWKIQYPIFSVHFVCVYSFFCPRHYVDRNIHVCIHMCRVDGWLLSRQEKSNVKDTCYTA